MLISVRAKRAAGLGQIVGLIHYKSRGSKNGGMTMSFEKFDNHKEEEWNEATKKIHELTTKSMYETSRGLDHVKTHEEIIELYDSIPEKEKTGEQTRCAAAALILLDRMNEARSLLDKWQDIGKDDEQWNIQYGWTYYLEKEYKEAIPYFDKVEELRSTESNMLGYLQECNEQIGNKEEAKRLKNRIREINSVKGGEKYKKENYYDEKCGS